MNTFQMSAQNELSPFRNLLKQVYFVHTSKVKELESEIKHLKEQLSEKERNTTANVGDCKRCIELEEAFKACKKTLDEQSKWFENFGQKFSIFNATGTENEFKDATKSSSCTLEASKLSNNLKKNSTLCDKNESAIVLQEKDTVIENHAEKLSISSVNQNFLSKVIRDDCESFDMYTVTFNQSLKQNLNSKPDTILAPDSLDIVLDAKSHTENGLNKCILKDAEKSKVSKFVEDKSPKTIEGNHQDCKTAHKRLSSDSLGDNKPKKYNKVEQLPGSLSSDVSKTEEDVSSVVVPKNFSSEPSKVSENEEVLRKAKRSMQLSKKKDAIVRTDDKNDILKSSTLLNNLMSNVKSTSFSNQTSPSLLPPHVNIPPKIVDLEPNDDDFLEQNPTNKANFTEDSWDTCDRKKIKKSRTVKVIKGTSKYKMTLDAPPLNYRKPIYKQTKLSKSIFQCKSADSNKKSPNEPKNNLEDDSFCINLPDNFQSSTPVDTVKSVVDIDATFIPDDFKLESPQYNTTKVKKNTVENLNLKNGNLFSNISFPEEVQLSAKKVDNSCVDEDDIEDSSYSDVVELKENMNSFDKLPVPEEPTYKYKNDVVRKKAERKQLNGFDCKECEKYYSELGLNEKEKKERMKKCSRHRGKYTPPATPDHFWELDFPDTEECKARGYLNATQKVNLNNICNI